MCCYIALHQIQHIFKFTMKFIFTWKLDHILFKENNSSIKKFCSLLTSSELATITDGTVLLGVHLLHKCHIPISFK